MHSSDQRAVALSGSDIPGAQELLVHSCEDCACPPSGGSAVRAAAEPPGGPLVRAREIVECPVDDEHTALFNPDGNGGVLIVNRRGRALLDLFATPLEFGGIAASGFGDESAEAAVRHLFAHDLLHPAGAPPDPRFAESRQLTAWLHVTNKCNLKCPYCYVSKSDDAMTRDTGRDSVDALVRSAVRNGFSALRLKYAGGEASLNADVLLDLHQYARERCDAAGLTLSAVLLSNGVAIGRRLAAALTEHGIAVMISLDGIGEAHDAQRPTVGGRGSSHLVLRTVGRLLEAGVRPHISITITSRNVDAVGPVVRFALERDLTFSFNFFRDNDCSSAVADLQYEEKAMLAGLEAAFAEIEENLPRWSVLGCVLDRGQLLAPRRRACGVGDDYVVIDQRGGIAKCHMEIGDTLGNVRTVDPVLAVRDDSRGIRNLLVEDKQGCRDCTWRHWCSGGCAAATFRATGRFDVRSPNCAIYRTIYPQAVRLEGLRLLRYAGR
ncbi:SPASM domain-containing protein [Amycolatopsis balhimycina DSM 5908]|uniref:SPASM domain-containing protein n=1 Tax=Amycolatopsis balhimycina DSM 5908 TaxID=1081091 RepID=A0A428VV81_AMYBA|nr:radical SAM protein [Amycolatopsis balhimycina]RSM34740.1 SPASM domain-containing protein [Amycolatopsis balhimycina DSM 5908]